MTTKQKKSAKRKTDANKGAKTAATMPNKMMLTYQGVAKEAGLDVTRETMWRWSKSGKMPKPLQISRRVTRFRYEDIKAWVADGCRRWPIRK